MAEIPPTRASLLVRLRDPHDQDAWREFVDLYAPLVYGYLRKQGLQDADAADLSQESLRVLVGAVSRLEYDPRRGSFRNFLFLIVRRRLSNWRRAQKTVVRSGTNPLGHQLLEQCPAPEQDETAWQLEWEQRLFARACEQVRRDVSDRTWQAFWRTAARGEPSKQVAESLGLTVAAVYLARSRILARLKELVRLMQEP